MTGHLSEDQGPCPKQWAVGIIASQEGDPCPRLKLEIHSLKR